MPAYFDAFASNYLTPQLSTLALARLILVAHRS
jgi:hypothetical protein